MQTLQDTRLPITALTAETIEQRNQVTVADIAGNDKCYYLNIDDTYPGTGPTRAAPARPRAIFVSVKRIFYNTTMCLRAAN